jgi:glycosyltransferase involved in cell wall biosynthesis
MMQPNVTSSVRMVFTIAAPLASLTRALPDEQFPVYSLETLPAGNRTVFDSAVLILAVGTEVEAAEHAARWIKKTFDNLMVVHIGEAVADQPAARTWAMPSQAENETGQTLALDTRMPFPWPSSLSLKKGGKIWSRAHSKRSATSPPTDMVCSDTATFSQAQILLGKNLSFHVLKLLRGNTTEIEDVATSDALPSILHFLTGPGEPNIAAIVPVHNRAHRIVACVESILSQTLPAKEVVVVDDGSTDDTLTALRSLESEVTIVPLEANHGVSTARNIGVESARCNWISFLDSDDLWTENKLLDQWQFLKDNPFYDIVQSEEIWIRNGTRVNPCNHHQKPAGWIWLPSLSLCLVSPSSVMMKKELFQKYRGFDPALPACEDYDLWLRISRDRPVGLDPNPSVIKHGGHADQLSRRYPAMDRFRVKALIKALDKESDREYQHHIKVVLKKKLTILANGCKKRQKLDEARYYQSLLEEIETPRRA